MKKTLIIGYIITVFVTSFSCSNDSYIFSDKEEQMKVAENQGALIGQWVLESSKQNDLVIGIRENSAQLSLQTPNRETKIESIKNLGDLGFVLELNDGNKVEKLMAKFMSYQRTTLVLLNVDGFDLGIDSEVPMTFKKVKEETVLTASSND